MIDVGVTFFFRKAVEIHKLSFTEYKLESNRDYFLHKTYSSYDTCRHLIKMFHIYCFQDWAKVQQVRKTLKISL